MLTCTIQPLKQSVLGLGLCCFLKTYHFIVFFRNIGGSGNKSKTQFVYETQTRKQQKFKLYKKTRLALNKEAS